VSSNIQDIILMILKYSRCEVPVSLYVYTDHTKFESANFAALQQNKNIIRKRDKLRQMSKKLQ